MPQLIAANLWKKGKKDGAISTISSSDGPWHGKNGHEKIKLTVRLRWNLAVEWFPKQYRLKCLILGETNKLHREIHPAATEKKHFKLVHKRNWMDLWIPVSWMPLPESTFSATITLSCHSELLVMARDHGDANFVPLLLFPFRSTVLVRVFDILISYNIVPGFFFCVYCCCCFFFLLN